MSCVEQKVIYPYIQLYALLGSVQFVKVVDELHIPLNYVQLSMNTIYFAKFSL